GKRQEINHQSQALLGDPPDLRLIGVLRIAAIDIDERGDILDHVCGQALRNHVPMPLHKHKSDDGLQDHHRGNDDEQRAGVQAFRHDTVEPTACATPAFSDLTERAVDTAHYGYRIVPLPGAAQSHQRSTDAIAY